MCTVLWWRGWDGRREVGFNRDEQRSRSVAEPPDWRTGPGGTPYLAPRDPVGGGTWFAVERDGGVTCVLNHTTGGPVPAPTRSRGAVVADSVGVPDGAIGPSLFGGVAPCLLLRVDPDGRAVLWTWDGSALSGPDTPGIPFVTTSSVDTARVLRVRRARYEAAAALDGRQREEALEALMRQQDSLDPAGSIEMSRPDARTVSRIRLTVGPGEARLAYTEILEPGVGGAGVVVTWDPRGGGV